MNKALSVVIAVQKVEDAYARSTLDYIMETLAGSSTTEVATEIFKYSACLGVLLPWTGKLLRSHLYNR